MRLVPGGVLFLFGLSSLRCSVFPDQAPAVGHSRAGSGGAGDAGNGGATAGSGAATGGSGTDAAPPASGGSGTGGTSGSGAALGSGGNADAGDASTDADVIAPLDGSTRTISYVASIADCLEAITQPQRGSCLSYSASMDGPNELWVDIRRTGHRAFTTYLAFEVDGTIANHTVESVELRVTVTNHPNAPGTGADVWQVVPFDALSLYVQAPATVGPVLAATPGPATGGRTVTYALPTAVVQASKGLFLSLTLPMGGDGTGYWGTSSSTSAETPPTLVVKYR